MKDIGQRLEKTGSKLINHFVWGKKKLAYPIRGNTYGTYILAHYNGGDNEKLSEFDSWLKLSGLALRHMIVKLDKEPEKSKEEEKEEEAEAEFEQFRVEGSNVVGARSAYQALKSSAVESEIKEKVKMFGEDDPDGEIDDLEAYLLYNANVWFNIYEKKLAAQMGKEPAWDVTTTVAIKPEDAVVKPEAGEAAGEEEGGEEEEGGDDFLDAALEPDAGAAEEVDAEKEGLDDELGL